jgi:hypothetical protein
LDLEARSLPTGCNQETGTQHRREAHHLHSSRGVNVEELRKTNQDRSVVWEATFLSPSYFRGYAFNNIPTRLIVSHGKARQYHTITLATTRTTPVQVRNGITVHKNNVTGYSMKDLGDGQGVMVTGFQRGHGSRQGRRGHSRIPSVRWDPFGLLWWLEGRQFRGENYGYIDDLNAQVLRLANEVMGRQATSVVDLVCPLLAESGRDFSETRMHKFYRYNSPRDVVEKYYRVTKGHRPFVRTLAQAVRNNQCVAFETVAECFKGLVPVELLSEELARIIDTDAPLYGRRATNAKGNKGYVGVRALLKQYNATTRRRLLRSISVATWEDFIDLPARPFEYQIPARVRTVTELHDGIFGQRLRRRDYLAPIAITEAARERWAKEAEERKKQPLDGGELGRLLAESPTYGDYKVVVPETVGQLEEMGLEFHNCMGTYNHWRKGEIIGAIYKGAQRIAAFQILGGGVAQFLGISNDAGWALLPDLWAFQEHMANITGKREWLNLFEGWGPSSQMALDRPVKKFVPTNELELIGNVFPEFEVEPIRIFDEYEMRPFDDLLDDL